MKAVAALLFLTFSLNSHAGLDYYPKRFIQLINSQDIDLKAKQSNELSIQYIIFELLTLKHLVAEDGSQTLVRDCAGANTKCYGQIPLGYKQARKHLFGQLHLTNLGSGNYSVKDVYCNKDYKNKSQGVGSIGPMRIPNANVLNCEHTWPQSKFSQRFPTHTQKGDLHHLFPTNSRSNSMRSNYPFGEVDEITDTVPNCSGPQLGLVDGANRNYFFTPPAYHRGNVARALFYFSSRYAIEISDVQEAFLRKWHNDDPVDAFEMARNDAIEEIQNNRNPFIDFPSLVDKIENF